MDNPNWLLHHWGPGCRFLLKAPHLLALLKGSGAGGLKMRRKQVEMNNRKGPPVVSSFVNHLKKTSSNYWYVHHKSKSLAIKQSDKGARSRRERMEHNGWPGGFCRRRWSPGMFNPWCKKQTPTKCLVAVCKWGLSQNNLRYKSPVSILKTSFNHVITLANQLTSGIHPVHVIQ